MSVLTILLFVSLSIFYTNAAPTLPREIIRAQPFPPPKDGLNISVDHSGNLSPAINADFPDPSVIHAGDGSWYAFATEGNGKHVQIAKASELLGSWEILDEDPLPDAGWTTGSDYWAPDVRQLHDGSYIMYFSGRLPAGGHCVGVARSANVTGPYTPEPQPWVCHSDQGGAIDPSGFLDPQTGLRYVVYKIDGNTLGHGGSCGNGVAPQVPTPIMMQQVDTMDGATPIGAAVQILDRTADDGPVVEAPNVVLVDGLYVLFFSSQCFDSSLYNVKYAWADNIRGPYQRAAEPLLQTPQFGLSGPGGLTSAGDNSGAVFHARCGSGRCMYAAPYQSKKYAPS